MKYIRRSASLLLRCPILWMGLLYAAPHFTVASDQGEEGLFGLPRQIVESYFPQSEQYLIPDDLSYAPLLDRARTAENRGDFSQASRYYLMAAGRVKGSPKAPYLLFKHAVLEGSLAASISALREIVDRYPEFPLIDAVRYEFAKRLFINGEFSASADSLEEIVEHERVGVPVFTPYATAFAAVISEREGDYEQAIAESTKSLEYLARWGAYDGDELAIRNHLSIARALIGMQELSRGEDLLRRILGTAQSELQKQEALLLLGDALAASGRRPEAFRAYTQLNESSPDSVFAFEARRKAEALGTGEEIAGRPTIAGIYDPSLLDVGKKLPGSSIPGTGGKAQSAGADSTSSGEQGIRGEETSGSVTAGQETGLGTSGDKVGGQLAGSTGVDSPEDALYFLQLGSFSDERNAENLAGSLRRDGYPAFTMATVVEGNRVIRVRLGGYSTREEASHLLEELKTQGYTGFIVSEK